MTEPQVVYEASKTTHWKNLFPNKSMLLGSHNLNQGEELVAVIKSVSIEKIRNQSGSEEQVPVVNFDNAAPMVLNITNTRTIAALYGDLHEGWIGRSIQLFATKVKAFGKETMALRIRPVVPSIGVDVSQYERALNNCKTMQELQAAFTAIPKQLRGSLSETKDNMKAKLS